MESERVPKPDLKCRGLSNLVCPCCGARSYYNMKPLVAWCWASGLIEIGETVPEGAIKFAHGPKSNLETLISALARHGKGASEGKLIVPGIPEAADQQAAGDALQAFIDWAGKGRNAKKLGVVFSSQKVEQ
jgi:hypothetical protein